MVQDNKRSANMVLTAGVVATAVCVYALRGWLFADVGSFDGSRGTGAITPWAVLVLVVFSILFLLSHAEGSFLKNLADKTVVGLMARRLLPAVLLGPTIIAWLSGRAEQAGWLTSSGAEAAEVISNIATFALFMGWNAKELLRADRQRKSAEVSAQQSEGRFADAFDYAPIGVALVDPGGKLLKVNPAFCEMVGYSEEELVSVGFQDITVPEDVKISHDIIQRTLAGEIDNYQVEKRYIHRGGQIVTAVVRASLVRDEKGEPTYFVAHILDISERKRAEQELRWKTAFLEAQINCSPDGILVVDAQGRQIYRNPRFDELWRIPAGSQRSSDDEKTLRHAQSMMKDPDTFLERVRFLYDRPDEMSQDELELKDGRFFDRYSAPVIGHDGTHFGRIWNFRDITERKRIEESLRESEARYLSIAANVPGMVYRFVIHADGTPSFPFVSEGCRDLFGLESTAVQGNARLLLDCVHPDDKEGFNQAIALAAADALPFCWTGRFQRADTGETRCFQVSSRAEKHTNGDIFWDGVAVDVTERKQAEEDRQAKEFAEQTNFARMQFFSRISHELRTPLNAILGFGQVLEFSHLESQDGQALKYILQGGRHLLSLVDQVLDLSRVEGGELHLLIEDVNADEVIEECVGLVSRLAEKRRVTCTVKQPGRCGRLRCDAQRLRQMLLNLLSNAIKYNREGGQVLISFERLPNQRLRLKVSDTGPGIALADLARLFVPFERLDAENADIEGTGLGLVVSRRIAEAMDGTVSVESEVGRGSTFWIELPTAVPAAAGLLDVSPTSRPMIAQKGSSRQAKVLYIEDNLSNLQVVKMVLASCRPTWQFLSARNGAKGLVEAREQQPDVILLDLHMPGMPGEEVLKILRQELPTRDIPVIVLSADATQPTRDRLLAAGADAYVTKPFGAGQLLEVLDATTGA